MRGLVLQDGQVTLRSDIDIPVLVSDEMLLHVRKAGICSTDMHLINGYMQFNGILGHEFVAQVEVGPEAWVGKRVVGEINVAEGTCEYCSRGVPSQCSNRTTVGIDRHDGAFADYLSLTTANLHVVPDSVSDDAAVFVEPLAAALQITETVHVSPRSRVAVVGIGRLGTLVVQVLRLTGADVSGIVRREGQATLLEQWGISSRYADETSANHFDIVVDCTGSPEGFEQSLHIVKPRGTLVLKSTFNGLTPANLTQVVVQEIQIVGSRCGPFEAALRLLEQQMIDTDSLINARYKLDDGLEALQHASQPGVLKVILEI